MRRLGVAFTQEAPQVDESARPGEKADELAPRLSLDKARAIAARHHDALVVGSDQVAMLDGLLVGKPGTAEAACEQLARASGRSVEFITAVSLVDARSGAHRSAVDRTTVRFRVLGTAEIARYVERERPLDCAGSFKSEALGIALFESVETKDPTALVGLPLIMLCELLRGAGLDPLA